MSEKTTDTAAEQRAAAVAALEFEREGYVRRGLDDRVKQVDAQLRAAKGDVKGRSPKKPNES